VIIQILSAALNLADLALKLDEISSSEDVKGFFVNIFIEAGWSFWTANRTNVCFTILSSSE
jgi:hypothetical protein